MNKVILGVAAVLVAFAAQPAEAWPHHSDRHSDYRDRYYESNRDHYRAQVYDYDRYTGNGYRNGYDHYEPLRDQHYLENVYSYDRHAPKRAKRHHRRSHH